jgi:GNAT superfamily N-acetyltransferase
VPYVISTDPSRLDRDLVHAFLSEQSYWARGRPRDVLERAIANSLCFGAYDEAAQVGFARVVTDRATFAWLADVFVVEEHRGRGVGRRLVDSALRHADLESVSRWVLATADAHSLYGRFGFTPLAGDERFMARERPGGSATGGPPEPSADG